MDLLVRDVTVGLRDGRFQRALFQCNLRVEGPRTIALVGENGVGKTTFLRILAGFAAPLAGSITINGVTPSKFREGNAVGLLPERLSLPESLSGYDFLRKVSLAGVVNGRVSPAAMEDSIADATVRGGVDFPLTKRIATLSNGMRQRLCLAASMLPLPALLLLDEPESGLDPVQRANLRTRIKTMEKDGTTVIVSSHDISGVCLTAGELWLIHRERLTSIDISRCESLTDVMSKLPNEWRASL